MPSRERYLPANCGVTTIREQTIILIVIVDFFIFFVVTLYDCIRYNSPLWVLYINNTRTR